MLNLMRGLVGRLDRLESSKMDLRKEVANEAKRRKVPEDHMITPERRPSMFDSTLGRGPRLYLDSLSETPEKEANRRKDDNAVPNRYFANH